MSDHYLCLGEKMARFTVATEGGSVRIALSLAGKTWQQRLVSAAEARRQWASLVKSGWMKW